ncbi:glutamate dehydrogenase/leucine dehydrogenase [Legionella oakridgensis ATCC 33761 = DSM 21215]|uniref:Glutamate dehydrogenase/leucine dehydrogenase n=1 Tax=Legionella oakridgensis ATCC 33761 = DSM 21215 TaxID=1268635 RepID=W0BBN2_9GAMM|nr:hypothetical protein [Legionella oakridgensis]AHE67938.1 glutamate dehydrogenase/leucine dehydrogenase [Legionella oakridgensis ATCC 33761 = DSM 21215]
MISGAGNVALHVAEKSIFEQAKVLTLSDREGFVYFKQGLSFEQLEDIKKLKFKQYGSLKQWAADKSNVEFYEDKKPWTIPCDIAIPCATQNEMDDKSLKQLLDNDVLAVCEGANMPLTAAAQSLVQDAGVLYGPGKAANAGGVAVSVLEQLQNLEHITWPLERVDQELQQIMISIHKRCLEYLTKERSVYDYKKGANLWSFKRLADALMAYGIK